MSKLWRRLATVAVLASAWSVNASAYTLSTDVACDTAAAVFSPVYTDCVGAYVLGNGENDVTNGAADNIVNQLLNDIEVFGSDDWTFLDKQDTVVGNSFFTVDGINSTSGDIEFDAASFNAAFGPDFLSDYDIAVSFKAAKNFSVYYWQAPIGEETVQWTTDGTAQNVNNGNPKDLSHASVYYRKKSGPDNTIPEPATLGLLGLGLAGIGLAKRRKS